jgi:acetyl esterase/lipase
MEAEDRSVFELPFEKPDRTISYGKSEDQVIDFYNSAKPNDSVIVLIHGGYWRPEYDRKHLAPFAKALSSAGWPVALIEYRRIQGNPDAMLQDAKDAITLIEKEHKNIILVGHSAGGQLALVLTNSTKTIGTIALAPVTDLLVAEQLDLDESAVSDYLGCPANIRSDLDPMRIEFLAKEIVLIHGTLDIRVPFEFSTRFMKNKEAMNLLFIPLDGVGHFELIDPRQEIFKTICQQVSRIIAEF